MMLIIMLAEEFCQVRIVATSSNIQRAQAFGLRNALLHQCIQPSFETSRHTTCFGQSAQRVLRDEHE